jgi:hypothetical protein
VLRMALVLDDVLSIKKRLAPSPCVLLLAALRFTYSLGPNPNPNLSIIDYFVRFSMLWCDAEKRAQAILGADQNIHSPPHSEGGSLDTPIHSFRTIIPPHSPLNWSFASILGSSCLYDAIFGNGAR